MRRGFSLVCRAYSTARERLPNAVAAHTSGMVLAPPTPVGGVEAMETGTEARQRTSQTGREPGGRSCVSTMIPVRVALAETNSPQLLLDFSFAVPVGDAGVGKFLQGFNQDAAQAIAAVEIHTDEFKANFIDTGAA